MGTVLIIFQPESMALPGRIVLILVCITAVNLVMNGSFGIRGPFGQMPFAKRGQNRSAIRCQSTQGPSTERSWAAFPARECLATAVATVVFVTAGISLDARFTRISSKLDSIDERMTGLVSDVAEVKMMLQKLCSKHGIVARHLM